MIQINGINHFALSVANLDESCDFYQKILKLKLIEKRDRDAFFSVGKECVIGLLQYPGGKFFFNQEFKPSKTGKAFTHFGFQADSEKAVFEMEKHLIKQGVTILKKAYIRWDGASVYFLDPNNYTLEFIYLKNE